MHAMTEFNAACTDVSAVNENLYFDTNYVISWLSVGINTSINKMFVKAHQTDILA